MASNQQSSSYGFGGGFGGSGFGGNQHKGQKKIAENIKKDVLPSSKKQNKKYK